MLNTIDVHTHLTPVRFRSIVLTGKNWHGMTLEDGELDNPKNLWSIDQRLNEMDNLGVDTQVVSPTDAFYQYDRDSEITQKIAKECNDEISQLSMNYPDRFIGLGTLPMQDVETAVKMMENGMDQGLIGFMIDDQVVGLTYDDPVFDMFWRCAEELGSFILIHQFGPTVTQTRTRRYFLHNTVGNLVDRTLTFGCLVGGGVMDRYPDLKICLGHAGGYVPYAVDRMDKGWETFPKYRGEASQLPSIYLNRFYYDTVTFTDENLRFLIDKVGIDRVILGSDWPAPMAVTDPVKRVTESAVLRESEKKKILSGNMSRILRT
jgi:aminocarboxymuconate-semialdehyde decarboxylase